MAHAQRIRAWLIRSIYAMLVLGCANSSIAQNCTSTLERVVTKMRNTYNVSVEDVKVRESSYPPSPYANATSEIFFVLYERPDWQVDKRLRGYSHNFMNSAQIQLGIASDLIRNCEDVYLVKYGLNYTDAIREYTINLNGDVYEYISPAP